MARKSKNESLSSRDGRAGLVARGRPHWHRMEPGLFLGYRKPVKGSGRWVMRHYDGDEKYATSVLATADDFSDPDYKADVFDKADLAKLDDTAILDFWQAQALIRFRSKSRRVGEAAKPYTVSDAMGDYFGSLRAKGKPTKEAERRFNVFIKPTLGDVEVAALTHDQIEKWFMNIAETPARLRTKKGEKQRHRKKDNSEDALRARRASANRILTILKAGLNHAWTKKRSKVPSDDAWRGVKPFAEVNEAKVDSVITTADAARLVNACSGDFKALVQGALLTGARYGQLRKLRVRDFQTTPVGKIRLTSRKGKDSKLKVYHATLSAEGVAFFESRCTGRAPDALIFPNTGRAQRAITMEVTREEKIKGGPLSSAERAAIETQVHANDDGIWHDSEQNRPMLEACERANINPPIGFHILRHTWASHAVMNGVPLLVVAKNLGHSDTRMVEKHYGHLAPSYIDDAIRAGAPKFDFDIDQTVTPIRR